MTRYTVPVNLQQNTGWLHLTGLPVQLSPVLPWRRTLLGSDGPYTSWTLLVGNAPKFADPAVEKIRREVVLAARRQVREAFGLEPNLADVLWDRTVR